MKRKDILPAVAMGMGLLLLTGCGSGPATDGAVEKQAEDAIAETGNDTAALTGERQEEAEEEADDRPKEAPQLPETGRRLEDFVPEGWEIWDSVELDFNEDGISDYISVLQAVMTDEDGYLTYQLEYPRILFAIASAGEEGYRLDFQDENVIRKRDEGGVFGDPYQPLTAEGTSFSTHTYGGSAWRWSEEYTYAYREGTWWLVSSEETYGYGDYCTNYEKNDWESGVGIRKERSSDWGPMEKNFELVENGDWESIGYDLEYEVPLDEQMTLEQAGKRWWLAPDRLTDWEVKEMVFASDVDIPADKVKLPGEAYIGDCDENCVLYTGSFDSDTVPEMMENRIPYLSMIYEINGGEIVAEVYVGDEPHPFYRMKTDGSGQEKIGQVPK